MDDKRNRAQVQVAAHSSCYSNRSWAVVVAAAAGLVAGEDMHRDKLEFRRLDFCIDRMVHNGL